MDKPLSTYVEELLWFDDQEQGTFCAIVLAPDDATARRMIGAEMLANHDSTLADQECANFGAFYQQHGQLAAWGDLGGTACPNCTSHGGRPMPAEHCAAHGVEEHAGAMECNACGYAWQPLGFGPARAVMEAAARAQIAGLDDAERASLADDDAEGEI